MTEPPPAYPPPPPPAPPPPPPPYPQRPPSWPKVIGIISIVFAGLGLICTPIGLATREAAGPAGAEAMEGAPPWYATYQTASALAGIVVAAILLVAGILLCKRRPAGRTMHITYAILNIVVAVGNVIAAASAVGQMDSGPAGAAPFKGVFIGGIVIGLVIGLAYPIFILVWFTRPKVRDEVAAWAAAQAAPAYYRM
jgi:hypothetical protein